MYYGARFYDPYLGRFISADSIVPDPGNPQSLNRYAYTLNNPLRYQDPTGHFVFEEEPDDRWIYSDPQVRSAQYYTAPEYEQGQPSDAGIFGTMVAVPIVAGGAALVPEVPSLAWSAVQAGLGRLFGQALLGSRADDVMRDRGLDETSKSVIDKLLRYLLNEEYPVGRSKATWFREALGFTQQNVYQLAKQIKFDLGKAVETEITEYGTKYNQVIRIVGANGKEIDVLFAWIRNLDGIVRLVTGVPGDWERDHNVPRV